MDVRRCEQHTDFFSVIGAAVRGHAVYLRRDSVLSDADAALDVALGSDNIYMPVDGDIHVVYTFGDVSVVRS